MNHLNRSKHTMTEQQAKHTPNEREVSLWVERGWAREMAVHLASASPVVARECERLKTLNAELLAALKDCAEYFSDFVETDYTEANLHRAALAVIAKAEGR